MLFQKNPPSFPVSLPLCIYVPFIPRPPPPPSQLSIISHDRWALRHCQNSPAPKILIPVFAPPSSLSSSSFPSLLPIMHALLCPLKVWGRGRGSATPAQLPAILLFWGGSCLIFLSVVFILALSIVTDPTPAPPLCLVAVHTAGPQHPWKGQREKESAGSVGSLVIFLLFFSLSVRLFFFFSSAASIFHPLAWPGKHLLGSVLSGRLFSFIPPLIPRLLLALQRRASFHVCNSRPSRMRIIAAACSCHNPVGCSS